MSTLSKIDHLAGRLAEKAAQESTSVSEMTEALKALGPYYTALRKAKPDSDEDSADDTSIGGIQAELQRVSETANGGQAVSGRSRRGRNASN
jgi:hypothetical protein